MNKIKLLIADDHQIISDGLKALMKNNSEISIIGVASNGKEAINLAHLLSPHIILMDVDMPIMNGIEATKAIKKDQPEIRIIILTMHNEAGLIKTLIAAGADAYLLKNTDQEELISAIQKVAQGKKYFSSDITDTLLNSDDSFEKPILNNSELSNLTSREIEILKLIAMGFSNKEIGEKLFISHRTVDTHRTNLMKKLDVSNIAGLIRFAIQKGLVS